MFVRELCTPRNMLFSANLKYAITNSAENHAGFENGSGRMHLPCRSSAPHRVQRTGTLNWIGGLLSNTNPCLILECTTRYMNCARIDLIDGDCPRSAIVNTKAYRQVFSAEIDLHGVPDLGAHENGEHASCGVCIYRRQTQGLLSGPFKGMGVCRLCV